MDFQLRLRTSECVCLLTLCLLQDLGYWENDLPRCIEGDPVDKTPDIYLWENGDEIFVEPGSIVTNKASDPDVL